MRVLITNLFVLVMLWSCVDSPAPVSPPGDADSARETDSGPPDARLPRETTPDAEPGGDLAPPPVAPPDVPVVTPPDGLEVVFLDVGQGDSILLRFPEGSTMLVDGGNKSAGPGIILPYLEGLHLTRLDYLVVTHPDADHCGGLDDVVYGVDIGAVWENGQVADTWAWWDFSDAVDDEGVPRQVVSRGDEETIDGCDVEVLNADEGWDDTNGNSIVLSIDCEGITVLLTGDAHQGTQMDLVDVFGDALRADIVKIPHHGSPDRFRDFPAHVQPGIAVCSVGANNTYGHPNPEVIGEWEDAGAAVYRTDEVGTVTVTAKDGAVGVELEW